MVNALATLTEVVASADAIPTRNSYEVFKLLSIRIAKQTNALTNIFNEDVPAFVEQIHELGVPTIESEP